MNLDTELTGTWHDEIDRSIRESRAFCVALVSLSGDVLFANPAMATLLGEPPIESFVHPTFEHLVGTSPAPGGGVFSGFATLTKDGENTSIFVRVYRRDDQLLIVGEIDVTSLSREYRTVVELNRENNRLRRDLIRQKHALQQEVEQRKKSEARIERLLAEKEMILREVHHRIKNYMNTVVSLLQLQSDMHTDSTTVSVLQDAAQRVRSMMLLYDKLYQSSELEVMKLDQYLVPLVKQVIDVFPHGSSIRLQTDIVSIPLNPKVLSELGIIVNELVSNAMKYAFPGAGEGTLTVTAHREGSAVSLSIADDGPGLPEDFSAVAQPGFGMTLVNALAEQLNGTIQFENDNGARFVLTFEPGVVG